MDNTEHGSLRASDDERNEVRRRLDIAVSEGRLDLLEYDARLRSAFTATTRGELIGLTADLPAAEPPPKPTIDTARRHPTISSAWQGWTGLALILGAIWAASSLVSGQFHAFWPAFPLLIWAAVILTGRMGGRRCGKSD